MNLNSFFQFNSRISQTSLNFWVSFSNHPNRFDVCSTSSFILDPIILWLREQVRKDHFDLLPRGEKCEVPTVPFSYPECLVLKSGGHVFCMSFSSDRAARSRPYLRSRITHKQVMDTRSWIKAVGSISSVLYRMAH